VKEKLIEIAMWTALVGGWLFVITLITFLIMWLN